MNRWRIEIDVEPSQPVTDEEMRRWLTSILDRREWPKIIKSTIVRTWPEGLL